jgi:hypothetical protein
MLITAMPATAANTHFIQCHLSYIPKGIMYQHTFEHISVMFLQACISKLLSEWGCGPLAKDDYVHEICRYGGAELHSVSAFIGKHLTAIVFVFEFLRSLHDVIYIK